MTGAISQDWESCQFPFGLDEKPTFVPGGSAGFFFLKNPLLCRAARPERGREASERFLMETLGRTQSKRRRRLALASGIRLLRSESGMGGHVLDAPTRVPHFPPIAQRLDVVRPGFDGHLRNTSMATTRKLITA